MRPFRPVAAAATVALLLFAGAGPREAAAAPSSLAAPAGASLYDEFMSVCVASGGDRARVAAAAAPPAWTPLKIEDLPASARGELSQLQDANIWALDYQDLDHWKLFAFDGIMTSKGRAIGPTCMILGDHDPTTMARIKQWIGDMKPVLEDKVMSGYLFYDVDGTRIPYDSPGARLQAGDRKPQMLLIGDDGEFSVLGYVVMDR